LVLYAALQSQRPSRRREIAILKSLDARRTQLRRTLIFEFGMLGALSGLLGAMFAVIMTDLLAYWLFELEPGINPSILLIGVAGGALLVGFAGYLNVRPLLRVPPVMLLQESMD